MRPEGLSHLKIPVTPSAIEPPTFRLVAQRHRVPLTIAKKYPMNENKQLRTRDGVAHLKAFLSLQSSNI
jgi:hypothetical protein